MVGKKKYRERDDCGENKTCEREIGEKKGHFLCFF